MGYALLTVRSECSTPALLTSNRSSCIVDTLPEGTWEFVCHPGYNDAELDQVRTRLRQSRETELDCADLS